MNAHDPDAIHIESLFNEIEGWSKRTACGKDLDRWVGLLISDNPKEITCDGCLDELRQRKERASGARD